MSVADQPPARDLVSSAIDTEPQSADAARQSLSGTARLGLWLCYLACATVPWTAVRAGGTLRIGDVFLLLSVLALLAADIDTKMPRFPEWVTFFLVTILIVGVYHEVFPIDQAYFQQRETVVGIQVLRGQDVASSNISVLIRFLIAVVGLPLIFIRARHFDSRALIRGAAAFTAGSAISGVISFTDKIGITSLSVHLTGVTSTSLKGAGLGEDPNYVALACVFSLPFVVWKLVSSIPRERAWAAVGLVTLALGIYGSGSRSGAGAGALAVLIPLLLLPRYRRALPVVAFLLALLGAAAFSFVPGVGHAVLKGLRLTSGQGTGSDRARTVVNTQAEHDFFHSPVVGVGLKVAGEAHIVYLQALAAGGILLFLGLMIFLLGASVRCLRLAARDEFAAVLFASIFCGAVFNAAQNALTLRVVYLPASMAAALALPPAGAAARRRFVARPTRSR